MSTVLYGRGYKGPQNSITTTPPALAVNTYPTEAKSFELQGRSLALNQWAQELLGENVRSYGVEITTEDGVITAIRAVQQYGFCGLKVSLTAGHKFFLYGEVNTNNKSNVRVILSDNNAGLFTFNQNLSATNNWQVVSTIVTISNASDAKVFGVQDLKSSGWDDINVRKFMLIDLTQMYGTGMEPTTIDQVKTVIGDKYIPYNPGILIHANNEWCIDRFNQLASLIPNTWSTYRNISYTVDGTEITITSTSNVNAVKDAGIALRNGHKYLISGSIKCDTSSNAYLQIYETSGANIQVIVTTDSTSYVYGESIYSCTSNDVTVGIRLPSSTTSGLSMTAKDIQLFDLTDIFGAGKEPLTVDECKLRFLSMGIDITKYQPYSPLGSNLGGKVDLGFNVWDEQVRLGSYNAVTGEYDSSYTDRLCDINPTPCTPNTTYYFKTKTGITSGTVTFYNSQMNFLSRITGSGNTTFTTPNNACYLHFSFGSLYGTTYNHDICINLSQTDTTKSPHNGDYRPYLMLRGIGSDFNVWDEEWKAGHLVAGIETDDGKYRLISKNYIPVLPNTTYFLHCGISCGATIYTYDADKNYLQYISDSDNTDVSFTTLSNSAYIKLQMYSTYGQTSTLTYKNDICINLSQPQTTINPHDGQYVPHLFDTYDSISGILTRRIAAVDLGTLTWTYSSGYGGFYATVTNVNFTNPYDKAPSILCSKYAVSAYIGGLSAPFITAWVGLGSDKVLVKDNYYGTDATTFKAALSGVMLLYELATPTIEMTIIQPISFVSGKLGKQYGVVDLGSLSWAYSHSIMMTTAGVQGIKVSDDSTVVTDWIWNPLYTPDSPSNVYNGVTNKTIAVQQNTGKIFINDTTYTNATAFKNSLHGQYLIYELSDSATNPTYATAGNLIQKTKGDVGDVDFNLTYNTLLNENKFLISYNVGTQQSPNKKLIDVGGLL